MKLKYLPAILAILSAGALSAAPIAPRVHEINLYGLKKISADRILHAAKVRPGDPLPGSKGDMEEAIGQIPGVVRSRVEAVCCEGPDVLLFIGIEERDGPHLALRSNPGGTITLPDEVISSYHDYEDAVRRAGAGQSPANTGGWQQRFAAYAMMHAADLRQALRESADPEQRAAAATVMGYSERKQPVIDDLQYALQDPDDSVRSHALGSLHIMALAAVTKPQLGLKVSPTWLIELLHSVALDDRMQSTDILLTLTDKGNRDVLDQVRTHSLPDLAEMARWESLRYALPPFLLIGRVSGLKDAEIQRRWSDGQREAVIDKALGHRSKRSEK